MKKTLLLSGALALITAVTAFAMGGAEAQVINFSDVAPGSTVNTQYTASFGITFTPQNPGPTSGQVFADNPGFPTPADPANNALVGIYSPIFVDFSTAFYTRGLGLFSFSVVPDPFGAGQMNVPVGFYDESKNFIGSLLIDQTVAGTYTGNFQNVSRVLLPADAFYTNLAPTAVPEPGGIALLMATGGVSLLALKRRK